MADFLSVELVGDRNLIRNLEQMPDTVRAILVMKVTELTERLRQRVEDNIQSRLGEKTGRLMSALDAEVEAPGSYVEGRVFIEGVPYAKAQELGASIPAHFIYPREAKVLAFLGATGEKVFASRVFHPGGQILPKYYMKDAYREMGPQISRAIKSAVVEGIRQKMRAG